MNAAEIYAQLATRMPNHAGVTIAPDAQSISAVKLTDREWLDGQLDLSAEFYCVASTEVVGTLWWYSASSILVAPTVESLVITGTALDPALASLAVDFLPDGRLLSARSSRVFDGEIQALGIAFTQALEPVLNAVVAASGASELALGAILTDSIANRTLWASTAAGEPRKALGFARKLVSIMDMPMPFPRYQEIAGNLAVHRTSCCLIYQTNVTTKCASCPRQTPEIRAHRMRQALA